MKSRRERDAQAEAREELEARSKGEGGGASFEERKEDCKDEKEEMKNQNRGPGQLPSGTIRTGSLSRRKVAVATVCIHTS